MSADWIFLDATDQLRALRLGEISARELLDASLAQTNRLNGQLNVVVARDLERAYATAEAIDGRRSRGEALGLLAGLPMTVKEAFDIEGLPGSAGRKSLLNRNAKDALVIERTRSAGAVIWGKTNTPVNSADWQTYNPLYGATNNPWDVKRTPGGSSGGSAAAVAAGMTALEIGADMGGSLRVPAAFCGVFSHKPTYGLVPQRGYVPPVDAVAELDMAVVGPMARSARDLRLLLSVIAAAPSVARAQPLALQNLKIGLWLDEPSFTLDPEVKASIIGLSERLAAMGAIIEPIKSPAPGLEMMRAYTTLLLAVVGYEMPWPQRAFYEVLRGPAKVARALGAGPFSWAHGALAVTARHSEWLDANEVRAKLSASVTSVFSRYNLMLAPATPVVAFPHNHAPMPLRRLKLSDKRSVDYLEMLDWVGFATIFGLPATTVPAGLSASGLPVGVQIIGAHGCDSLTISFAESIEAQIGGFRKPPNC